MALAFSAAAGEYNEYVDELLARANNGDVQAAAELGGMYFFGRDGVPQDDGQAFKWLSMSVGHERGPSILLGLMYYQGRFVERDYEKARELLSQSAAKRPIAKNIYEELFHNGKPIRYIDDLIAQAERGDAEAQFELAMTCTGIWEMKRDMDASLYWLTRAAEQGYLEAQRYLGQIYTMGPYAEGEPDIRNGEMAVYWLTKAAGQGDAEAMSLLGYFYADGMELIAPDLAEARKWHVKAAETDHSSHAFLLAEMYERGVYFAQDDAEAFKWYLKAAEAGRVNAMMALVRLYREGAGVERNEAGALAWQLQAAPQLLQRARNILADLYLRGNSGYKNERLAGFWREASRGLDSYHDMALLADIYSYGLTVKKDVDVALKYYEQAAEAGHLDSQQFLGYFYGGGAQYYDAEPDYVESAKWYGMAATQNSADALYELGKMYLEGRGVTADYVKAYVFMAKAYVLQERFHSLRNKYQAILKQDITPLLTAERLREAQKILEQEDVMPEQYL